MENYVLDTSVVIEKVVSKMIKKKQIKGKMLVPQAVVAELENQANSGLEIGFIGLEELQEIRELGKEKDVELEFVGKRPTEAQIKYAKAGEIDAYIREIAYDNEATLITADRVQVESAKVYGIKVKYIEPKKPREKIELEKFFDETTMSVHLKEKCFPFGKKGKPGNWELVKISNKELTTEEVQTLAKEVVEKARIDPESFVEISRRGSTIVQYKNYRVVITKPPVSDGWEITAVRPLKKLNLDEYEISEELLERLKEKVSGVLIAGEPGSGKSTLAQAIAEFYSNKGKITKTIESPRDLQVFDAITQYSKNFTSDAEIHDILFLSRPDNVIFDEMRDTPDFFLYKDLRLSGIGLVGVIHSSTPIDAIQRFLGRLEIGMIPSVLDIILFMDAGKIARIYSLKMTVKVPTGMTEADLARPVVEVFDYETKKLEYEIYSYGEQTVVIPVEKQEKKKGVFKLAEKTIKNEFKRYADDVDVEVLPGNKAVVCVPEDRIAKIIGAKGKTIDEIEKRLGLSIEVKELKREKGNINFELNEDKKFIRIFTEPGMEADLYINGKYEFTAFSSRKGEIKFHKKSKLGRDILKALDRKRKIELKA